MAMLHQRLAHAAELGLLARALAAQPSLRIGPALVGGVRALLAVEVHPPIAGAAAIGPWRWRGFVLRPEALQARGRLDQGAVHAEMLVAQQAPLISLQHHFVEELAA